MALRVGIIGGTGLYAFPDSEEIALETPAGEMSLWRSQIEDAEVFFLPRHGPGHSHVPLRVPHEAHLHMFRSARCDYVIGTNNVGSLRPTIKEGEYVVPDDFIDLHRTQRPTLYPDEPVHVDFATPYCPTIRKRLVAASNGRAGVYVGVDGPRFETRAEVAWMRAMGGDVVGMTGVPEAVIAHEAGLCYASLCFVGNMGTGLGRRLSVQDIQHNLLTKRRQVVEILRKAIRGLPKQKRCHCGKATMTLRKPVRGR